MRDALCCRDGDAAAVAALLPKTSADASLGSGGEAADGDLGAQVESLVGLLRSVSGNVECVLETLRSCADQLQAITSRRKSARHTQALLAGAAAAATAKVKRRGSPSSSSPPPSGDGRSDDALLLLAERPTAIGRRRPGGCGGCSGGGGLDDAHDLDWDLSGLELGHTQRSQMATLAVGVSWTSDDTGGCDELATLAEAAPSQHSHDSRQPLLSAVDGLRCARCRDYEEDMERALEHCFESSSRDANSDDDEVTFVDGGDGGGTTGEIGCRSLSASPVSPPTTTTDSSSVVRLRRESGLDQQDHRWPGAADAAAAPPRWDCHGERGCGRGGNYRVAADCAQPDRANAIGGGCIVNRCDNDDDDRVAYDPTVNTWSTYALTCAAEDRV